MTLEKMIGRAFGMDEASWARHANPLSVWTRNTALPLLILAFWSRAWIGRWSLLAILAAILWTWLNARIFPPPHSTENWASKAVLGERIWMERRKTPVPLRHRVLPSVLSIVSAVGVIPVVWGVYSLSVWPVFLGAAMIYLSKLWFLDRMVWLYEDVRGGSEGFLQQHRKKREP